MQLFLTVLAPTPEPAKKSKSKRRKKEPEKSISPPQTKPRDKGQEKMKR